MPTGAVDWTGQEMYYVNHAYRDIDLITIVVYNAKC